jgi:hypothetical protein
MLGNAAELDTHRQVRLEDAHEKAEAETASDTITVRPSLSAVRLVRYKLFCCYMSNALTWGQRLALLWL